MTTITPDRTVSQAVPAAFLRRIAVFVVAVLGLGWLGPVIDRAVADSPSPLSQDVNG